MIRLVKTTNAWTSNMNIKKKRHIFQLLLLKLTRTIYEYFFLFSIDKNIFQLLISLKRI